jgi:nitrite reductase/ring-hydroxylating ferredoxin subunit
MDRAMSEASSNADAVSLKASLPDTAAGEVPWQKLDGIDPVAGRFPARARVDDEGILIFKTGSGFRGVQRSCPHLNATLMDAELVADDTMIRCRQHVFTFRFSDGRGVNCPGFSIRVFEVKNDDGALYARRVR